MEEEVNQKVVSLAVRASKLTAKTLVDMLKMYLNAQKGKSPYKQRKQSVKDLVGQNAGVTNIEIADGNIKSFERVARKYGVDFAVKKDKTTEPPKYYVFFKARDQDVLAQAFKEYVANNSKQQNKPSIRKKLAKFIQLAKTQNRQRSRDKSKNRGDQSL